jgi:hypothetical protein
MDNTSAKKCEKKDRTPTRSVTVRLHTDEIEFLESLAGNNITGGLRKLITFGRAVGCSSNLVQTGGADITFALIGRIERLERTVTGIGQSPR